MHPSRRHSSSCRARRPRSALADDISGIVATGQKGLLEIMAATHTGLITEEFSETVLEWIATARHPRFERPYIDLVYQTMLELMTFFRANGFVTFIVSGGGIEFMQRWSLKIYDIPPEQVVGSSGVVRCEFRDGKPERAKEPTVEFIDDGPGRPVGINRFIERRPISAFGTPTTTSRCWNTPRATKPCGGTGPWWP
ncbi:MAG: haloacid dehalogenase-like hydrolase [Enhydrobacter sp.]|nr:haloacid dehalogenase-like hydrolase [Enhydrobacter sp.]